MVSLVSLIPGVDSAADQAEKLAEEERQRQEEELRRLEEEERKTAREEQDKLLRASGRSGRGGAGSRLTESGSTLG